MSAVVSPTAPDVEDLNYNNYTTGLWFLGINAITFCLGIMTVIYATFVTVAANGFRSEAVKASFAHTIRFSGWLCSLLYLAGLVFFNAGYAMYGYAKFSPMKPEPFWTAVALFGVLAVVMIVVAVQYRAAVDGPRRSEGGWSRRASRYSNRGVSSGGDGEGYRGLLDAAVAMTPPTRGVSADSDGGRSEGSSRAGLGLGQESPAPSRRLAKQLDILSMRALFFAGFAYFAVSC